jgi:hypothetical protein
MGSDDASLDAISVEEQSGIGEVTASSRDRLAFWVRAARCGWLRPRSDRRVRTIAMLTLQMSQASPTETAAAFGSSRSSRFTPRRRTVQAVRLLRD